MPSIGHGDFFIAEEITVDDVQKISGVAPQMDDTDKLAVSLYGKDSAAGDTEVAVDSAGAVKSVLQAGTAAIGKLAANSGVDIGDVDVTTLPALEQTTVALYNVTLTSADTEYSQALPANCRAFMFQCRTSYAVRYAFVTGKVATPTAPYFTLKANTVYNKEHILLASMTLYLASAQAGVVVEIEAWT